jgi:PTH1 family peptidyl-tRNA hydrolase
LLIEKCIVGLGNPGAKYFNTRHNIGFLVIDKLAEFFKINRFEYFDNFLAARVNYKDRNILLIKPLTYMNSSGMAVRLAAEIFGLTNDKFLIIYDDANLDFGVLRIRPAGSDGGQNGIASVIYEMESEDIPRLRIGIKNEEEIETLRKDNEIDLAEFVLSPFTENESNELYKVIDAACDAVLFYINNGITETMNSYNRNVLDRD